MDELVSQLKSQNDSSDDPHEKIQNFQNCGPTSGEANESTDDQMELKTMVDAIAAASHREAEAHETAITLAKENEELREKIRVLIEDNNKLIELYEGAVSGCTFNQPDIALQAKDIGEEDMTSYISEDGHVTGDVEQLQHQLHEMHEENDRLLGLYEKAMQEKDELKKLISSYDFQRSEVQEEIKCDEKQVNMDGKIIAEKHNKEKIEELSDLYEKVVQERDDYKRILSCYELNCMDARVEMNCEEKLVPMDDGEAFQKQVMERPEVLSEETLRLVRSKLDQVQGQLEAAEKAVFYFDLLEKANFEVDVLQNSVEALDQSIQLKRQELSALRSILPEMLERRTVLKNKFMALKIALQSISSKVQYWDKREEQARAKVKSCSPLEQKKEELRHLKIRKDEANSALTKACMSESRLINDISELKSKQKDAETKRKENERVLHEIDNNPDISSQRATTFGKASEMLKSEEDRFKISAEIRQKKEELSTVQKEMADSKKISEALGAMIQSLEAAIESGTHSLTEAELRLKNVVAEREILSDMQEDGMGTELSKLLVEYQQCIFQSDLKEEEIKLFDEALHLEVSNLEEFRAKQKQATQKLNNLLEESKHAMIFSNSDNCSQSVSVKVEKELGDVQKSLA